MKFRRFHALILVLAAMAVLNAASGNASSSAPGDDSPLLQNAPQNTQGLPSTGANAKPEDDTTATYVKTVNEVSVVFTVTDKHGHFINDLKKDDIRILDDSKPAASILSFNSETDLPLRVGLLVDASSSIRDRFRFEQESAVEFLHQIIRPDSDQAFVIGFDSVAEVTQDFTDDTNKLAHGVQMLRPGGGTALYDAIYEACKDKLAKVKANVPTRRAIILLSDGEDNQSRYTREQAIEMAQRAEVIIYAISTNISGIKTRGDKVLERFANTTGGRVFFPLKLSDVASSFSLIQDELRSQYAVAYKPADFLMDGRFRSIDIASVRKGLRVRSRRGYYAPKQ